jgi:hypothetical protein
MARPPGLPKTGGRKRGSRNLKTLILRESLTRVGFDIVQEIRDIYPKLDAQTKAKVLMAFLPFLFPKPSLVHLYDLEMHDEDDFDDEDS